MSGQFLTPNKFLKKMEELGGPIVCHAVNLSVHRLRNGECCRRDSDNPESHIRSDKVMEELLIALGYGEGVKVLRETERWYE